MGKVLYEHMKAHGIKSVGYIGYSDSYGDLWVNDFKTQAIDGLTWRPKSVSPVRTLRSPVRC